jgi:hypothetical protein
MGLVAGSVPEDATSKSAVPLPSVAGKDAANVTNRAVLPMNRQVSAVSRVR